MKKIRIFISSRVNTPLTKLQSNLKLKDLRTYLRDELEKIEVLGETCFKVIINETAFDNTLSRDWFELCMDEMDESDIFFILYSGEAGYSDPNVATLGICHEEFVKTADQYSAMTYIFDISSSFKIKAKGKAKEKNDAFRAALDESYLPKEVLTYNTFEELKVDLLNRIKRKTLNVFLNSLEVLKNESQSANVFGNTLVWSKLNYDGRSDNLNQMLAEKVNTLPAFKDVILQFHAIPDHMSVADARNRIERPFLEEYKELKRHPKKKKGIIHFIGVYGNVTVMQAKRLIGYPDLTAIKTPFGYYVWDKIRHIQIIYFSNCVNPERISTRLTQLHNWLSASRELPNILNRAKGRWEINKVIKDMQKYSSD